MRETFLKFSPIFTPAKLHSANFPKFPDSTNTYYTILIRSDSQKGHRTDWKFYSSKLFKKLNKIHNKNRFNGTQPVCETINRITFRWLLFFKWNVIQNIRTLLLILPNLILIDHSNALMMNKFHPTNSDTTIIQFNFLAFSEWVPNQLKALIHRKTIVKVQWWSLLPKNIYWSGLKNIIIRLWKAYNNNRLVNYNLILIVCFHMEIKFATVKLLTF